MRCATLLAALALAAGLLDAPPARAVTFVLDDGETIEGAIVAATRNTITIRRSIGGIRQIPRRELREVRLDTAAASVRGRLVGWRDGRLGLAAGSEVIWIENDRIVERAPSTVVAGRRSPAEAGPPDKDPGGATSGPLVARPALAPEPAAGPADLPRIAVRVLPETVTESTAEVVFALELSHPLAEPLVVIYATVDGDAKAGVDYDARQGILTLPAGATANEIRTPLRDDDLADGDKEFQLFLAADPERLTIAEPWIKVVIRDDD